MKSFARTVQIHVKGMAAQQFAAGKIAAMLGRADLPSRSELAALRPAIRLTIIGIAAFIGIVGAMTASAVIFLEPSTNAAPAWLGGQKPFVKKSQAQNSSYFEHIAQRPLFSRNRQFSSAPEPDSPLPPVAAVESDVALKGIFMNDGISKALLTSTQTSSGVWLEVDGEIDGWRVAAVTPDQVVLEGQRGKLTVPLYSSGR